ncbi:MAG TPA: hypothetical protein VD813_05530 [Pseudonocardia sp.]|nr:hypothetical protein [Pseudonocardia sp.]
MSDYHLQARRSTGEDPRARRDETRLAQSDCLDTLSARARELAADGFTVWIFRRVPASASTTAYYGLSLVTTLPPADATARDGRQKGVPASRPVPPGARPDRARRGDGRPGPERGR